MNNLYFEYFINFTIREIFVHLFVFLIIMTSIIILIQSRRSYFTILEFLITCYSVIFHSIFFIDYLILKISISAMKLIFKKYKYGNAYKNMGNAYYFFRKYHGYAMTKDQEKHYIGKKFKLVELNQKKIEAINTKIFVGKSYYDKNESSKILKTVSKCHDNTASYLFYISADMHLTYTITILLRWYSCIAIFFTIISCIAIENQKKLISITNIIWMSYYTWDNYNYTNFWLKKNKKQKNIKFENYKTYEFTMDLIFFILYIYILYFEYLKSLHIFMFYFIFWCLYLFYYIYRGEVQFKKMSKKDVLGRDERSLNSSNEEMEKVEKEKFE